MPATRTRLRRRIRIPRHFSPGNEIDATPGNLLEVAVLGVDRRELFGVDLASGAFVRAPVIRSGLSPAAGEEDLDQEEILNARIGAVVRIVAGEGEPIDAGRPEVVWPGAPVELDHALRNQPLRRLLRAVATPERPRGLILGSRAPSLSYADLDPTSPSMMLVKIVPSGASLIAGHGREPRLTLRWAGLEQSLPIHDQRATTAARAHEGRPLGRDAMTRALGFKPGFALIAFAPVEKGYVRKVVISLLRR